MTSQPKTLWLGPAAAEQKPELCSRCKQPVVRAYRVYKREFNSKTGEWSVTKGQYEIAHAGPDNMLVFDGCLHPSLLEQLQEKAQRDAEKTITEQVGAGGGDSRRTVHWETKTEKGGVRVGCGARGSLWTTLDREAVTCSNCKIRLETEMNQIKGEKKMSSTETTTGAAATGKKMTAADIKEKIAKAKAAKTAGAAATIVEKDGEGLPVPQATATSKVKKQAVQATKAEKAPKTLNLCGCGCGAAVKSSFLPGHDARLHGWIKKLGAGTMSLSEIPAQVKDGMYNKVKQTSVKDSEGQVTLAGVAPVVQEADYLKILVGKGGPASA